MSDAFCICGPEIEVQRLVSCDGPHRDSRKNLCTMLGVSAAPPQHEPDVRGLTMQDLAPSPPIVIISTAST